MKYLKLFETYNSNKELTKLCKEILNLMSDLYYKFGDNELPVIELQDINYNNYIEIKDFIKNNPKLQIFIDSEFLLKVGCDNKTDAMYMTTTDGDKVICLKTTYNTMEVLNKYSISTDTYYFMETSYTSSLLHELVHAYDDYRSKGLYKGKFKGLTSMNVIEDSPLKYSNSKHEVDARFNQAIQKTKLKDWTDVDEEGILYDLLPFEVCLKSFRRNFLNYHVLPKREKKRIDSMFAKYYIKYKSEFTGRDEN